MNLEQPNLLKIFYEVTHMKKDRARPTSHNPENPKNFKTHYFVIKFADLKITP